MTDEVTSQLSKLSALRVIGRAGVAKFKDARSKLPAMVQELGIGSVVTDDKARTATDAEPAGKLLFTSASTCSCSTTTAGPSGF